MVRWVSCILFITLLFWVQCSGQEASQEVQTKIEHKVPGPVAFDVAVPPVPLNKILWKKDKDQKPLCFSGGWCWEYPKIQGNRLTGVWAASKEDIWAVGFAGTVLRYNGNRWRNVELPAPYQATVLRSVWGSGPSDVWLAGGRGVLLHFDGTHFTDHYVDYDFELYQVTGVDKDHVWVRGFFGALFAKTGEVWSSALLENLGFSILSLSATSPDTVWLNTRYEGELGEPIRNRILIGSSEHWKEIPSPFFRYLSSSSLKAFGPNDAWFAGISVSYEGGIWHWNGSVWNREPIHRQPDLPFGGNGFFGLWGDSSSNVWTLSSDVEQCRLFHQDGTKWSEIVLPKELFVRDGYSKDGSTWMVGVQGTILQWDGDRMWQLGGPQNSQLQPSKWVGTVTGARVGIAPLGIVQSCEDRWCLQMPSSDMDLSDIWQASDGTVFAAGKKKTGGGVVFVYENSTWREIPITSTSLHKGFGFGKNDVWVSGDTGMYHFNGVSWTFFWLDTYVMTSNQKKAVPISGLWGFSHNDLWVIGGHTVYRFDGNDFNMVPLPMQLSEYIQLYGIWGSGPSSVFVVGASGTIFFGDGRTWSKQKVADSESQMDFFSVMGMGDKDVWVAGDGWLQAYGSSGASLLHFDGTRWSKEDSVTLDLSLRASSMVMTTDDLWLLGPGYSLFLPKK